MARCWTWMALMGCASPMVDIPIIRTPRPPLFRWADVHRPPPSTIALTEVVYDECNARGWWPGQCPEGFTCGPSQRFDPRQGRIEHRRMCVGDGGPYDLSIDVALPTEGEPVTLRFSMADGSWPLGAPGDAGELLLVHEETGARLRTNLPTDQPELQLLLEPGHWHTRFLWEDGYRPTHDWQRYPAPTRRGTLVVDGPGEVDIQFDAAATAVLLTIDDLDMRAAVSCNWGQDWTLSGEKTGTRRYILRQDEPLGGTLVLQSDRYELSIVLDSDAGCAAPPGEVRVAFEFDAKAPSPRIDLDVSTLILQGQVLLGGEAHTTSLEVDDVLFRTEPDGTFSHRVLPDGDLDLRLRGLGEHYTDIPLQTPSGPPDFGVVDVPYSPVNIDLTVHGLPPATQGFLWFHGIGMQRVTIDPVEETGEILVFDGPTTLTYISSTRDPSLVGTAQLDQVDRPDQLAPSYDITAHTVTIDTTNLHASDDVHFIDAQGLAYPVDPEQPVLVVEGAYQLTIQGHGERRGSTTLPEVYIDRDTTVTPRLSPRPARVGFTRSGVHLPIEQRPAIHIGDSELISHDNSDMWDLELLRGRVDITAQCASSCTERPFHQFLWADLLP